ncbi:MAG: DnaJ domain-containing protein [Thermodesulfobacteriota bacterium]
MPKDYYLILGLSRDADCHEIKQAYRNLAKKIHPDVTDCRENREKFLEVKEAYETLADETKRRHYDRKLASRKPGRQPAGNQARSSRNSARPSYENHFFPGFSSGIFQDILNVFSGFPGTGPGDRDLFFEAVLSPREARSGGDFPIHLPVLAPCPHCGRSRFGHDPFCPVCGGRGMVHSETEVSLRIPPHVRDGAQIRFGLDQAGPEKCLVTITVRIRPR